MLSGFIQKRKVRYVGDNDKKRYLKEIHQKWSDPEAPPLFAETIQTLVKKPESKINL